MSNSFLEKGTLLQNQFEVGEPLGHGGFANTYEGWNRVLANRICIKEYFPRQFSERDSDGKTVVPKDEASRDRFLSGRERYIEEARSVASLHDVPGVEFVYTFFEENETGYIVFEFLDGCDLRKLIRNNRMLPYAESRGIVCSVLETLKEIHARGVLHRDIAPDNVFITNKGAVKLIDFGSSRTGSEVHQDGSEPMLKQGYAPVEQYSKTEEQGTYTDIYAVGALMYRLLTGETPPPSIEREKNDTLRLPSELGIPIPEEAEMVLMTALNVKPEHRIQSVDDFLSALQDGTPYQIPVVTAQAEETTKKQEEAPMTEAWEDAPATEAWEDAPAEETPEETPVTEAWEDAPVQEAPEGTPVEEAWAKPPTPEPMPVSQEAVDGTAEKKTKFPKIAILLILLILVAGGIVAGVFLLGNNGEETVTETTETSPPSTKPTATPTPAPTATPEPVETPKPTPGSLIGMSVEEAENYLSDFGVELSVSDADEYVYDDSVAYGLICQEEAEEDDEDSIHVTCSLGSEDDWVIDPKEVSGTTRKAIRNSIRQILKKRESIRGASDQFAKIIKKHVITGRGYSSSVAKDKIIETKKFNIRIGEHKITVSRGKQPTTSSSGTTGGGGNNSSNSNQSNHNSSDHHGGGGGGRWGW